MATKMDHPTSDVYLTIHFFFNWYVVTPSVTIKIMTGENVRESVVNEQFLNLHTKCSIIHCAFIV